jgi:hypothetical protein
MLSRMDALTHAEQTDGYRKACAESDYNSIARYGQNYTFFPCQRQTDLQNIVDHYDLTKGSRIITLHPTADGGFPHTRPENLICMPADFPLDGALKTLLHEACHLSQRTNPAPWVSYSMRQGWWPVAATELPATMRERVRINPDTMAEPFWAWQDYHVPLPLFVNELHPKLNECDIRWFDRRNRVLYTAPPPSFKERYGTSAPQPEHPYEVSAVELSVRGIKTRADLMNVLLSE